MAQSQFVEHCACNACGSSDAAGRYSDGSIKCHKCGDKVPGTGGHKIAKQQKDWTPIEIEEIKYIQSRKLDAETCKKYEYGFGTYHGERVHVTNVRSPSGKLVGQKIRKANKDFVFLGNFDEAGLYGQHTCRDSGKIIVITEGEIDALSVSQQQGNKWPVVSVPNGASGAKKAIAKQLEWLQKFDSVVLMFDMDDDGRKAAAECVDLFEPGKCKVASLPLKDANEMLVAGRGHEIIDAIWGAKTIRPDGILAGTEMWERMIALPNNDHVAYPWECMNDKFLGRRRGEIVTFTAGTGIGKSAVVRQIVYDTITRHNEKTGLMFLEESPEETTWHLTGLEMQKRLLIDRSGEKTEEMKAAWDKLAPNIFLYDHFGSTDDDNLLNKMRYFVKGLGCTTIVLDHISIVVSGIEEGDERRIIDNLMTKLAKLVQELNCRLILISHLKKPDGTPFEEGGEISMTHLRGSASIGQLSWDIIALERNQQDEAHSNWTTVRSLKCRRTGRTGVCGIIAYDDKTGVLTEINPVLEVFNNVDAQPKTKGKRKKHGSDFS
jgi:twinkle protein